MAGIGSEGVTRIFISGRLRNSVEAKLQLIVNQKPREEREKNVTINKHLLECLSHQKGTLIKVIPSYKNSINNGNNRHARAVEHVAVWV